MRDYQRKKNNPYKLPHFLYKRMLYLVKDYERIRAERMEILHSTPEHDGIPTSGKGNPTEAKGIKLAMLDRECSAIENALSNVPQEYRNGIMNHIIHDTPFPIDADYETYGRWQRRFIYYLAKNLHHIF